MQSLAQHRSAQLFQRITRLLRVHCTTPLPHWAAGALPENTKDNKPNTIAKYKSSGPKNERYIMTKYRNE